ncbi:uncharacterized protein LOC143468472 isoform X1 [Clavelina lepadiformis]|uniref:uncharacterized protein LOC143468472 isoform X1 n=2 Tax=Clavelina lepadiformis TaxID=159417 RepID=UPI004041D32F
MLTHALCVLVIICGLARLSKQTDLALVSGSTGTVVTLRCVDLITSSGIFPYDGAFLRRLAYVETSDGTAITATGEGGIWKISAITLGNLMDKSYDASTYYPMILSQFNITWTSVAYNHLDIPLYSALAARLVLAHVELNSTAALPATLPEQYLIWDFYFREEVAPIDESTFISLVNSIISSTLCASVYRDVMFLVDNSAPIASSDFETIKSFLRVVVAQFDISSSKTRIGLVTFTNVQEVDLKLNNGTSLDDVTNSIAAMTQSSITGVQTGFAITQGVALFGSAYGGRGVESGVARVLVVLSSTESMDDVRPAVKQAIKNNVGIIAIGASRAVPQSELAHIAAGSVSRHMFQVTDVASLLTEFTSNVPDAICDEPVLLDAGSSVNFNLNPGESQTFAFKVDASGTNLSLSTTQGTASTYYSTAVKKPSSAIYDFKLNISRPNNDNNYHFVPTSEQLSENNECILYGTIESTSRVGTSFEFDVGEPVAISYAWNVTSQPITSLSGANIAGVVFACLIFICGLVIAIGYYWTERGVILDRVKKQTQFSSDIPLREIIPEPVFIPSEEAIYPLLSTEYETEPDVASKSTTTISSSEKEEENVRLQLRLAVENGDIDAVTTLLEELRKLGLDDVYGDLNRAERLIGLNECKQGLIYAMELRNVKYLERAIFNVKQQNYENELKDELRLAEAMLKELKNSQDLIRELIEAIAAGNREQIKSITLKLRAMNGWDQATIDRMLEVHDYREKLERSMKNRDLELATTTLKVVEEKGFEKDLPVEVSQAKKMTSEFKHLEKLKTEKEEENVRLQLRLAVENGDIDAVTTLLEELRKLGLDDVYGDLNRAERLIGLNECKQGLSYAMELRNVKYLERAIFNIKQQNYENELKDELRLAEEMLKELKSSQDLMRQLIEAMSAGNREQIKSITLKLRAMNGWDQATIDRMLEVHDYREKLERSMKNRDLEPATTTLKVVEEKGFEKDLPVEVSQAKKMTSELEYLEKLKTEKEEENVRLQLRLAVENGDIDAVTTLLEELRKLGLDDEDGDLIRAERLIGLNECKQGLKYAVEQRNVKYLERAIFNIKQQNYENELKDELRLVEAMLKELKNSQDLMRELIEAIAAGNREQIKSITLKLRAMNGCDQATIDRMLEVYNCRERLERSMKNRDLELATTTLKVVEEKGFEKDLPVEVSQAKKMASELEYLEQVRRQVLELKNKDIAEIRSYTKPPAGVHEVISCAYLILGYPAKALEDWINVKVLMGKTGKEGLKAQVTSVDPRKVDTAMARKAKEIVERFDLNHVKGISNGLALFYIFVRSVVDEVEKLNSGALDAPSPFFYGASRKSKRPSKQAKVKKPSKR